MKIGDGNWRLMAARRQNVTIQSGAGVRPVEQPGNDCRRCTSRRVETMREPCASSNT